MNRFLLSTAAISLLSVGFVACSDDDDASFKAENTFHYNMNISSEAGVSQSLLLDSLSGDITGIVNAPKWTEITQGESEDGHPVINVKVVNEGTVNKSQNAEVTVTAGTQRAIVNLKQEAIFVPNTNGNEEFEAHWDSLQSVTLYNSSSAETPVQANLPWADVSMSTLPDAIVTNYKKVQGWEMAFNTTGTRGMNRANYFGLYNRYTGILRVFYYISEAATDASEYSFTVQMGRTDDTNYKQPFAHNLRYGVPNDRFGKIDNKTNFYGDKQSPLSFQSIVVPYRSTQNTAISVGWTAFDIDMSGYTPSTIDWKNSSERLAIAVNTLKNSSITLAGTLNQQAFDWSSSDSNGTQEMDFLHTFDFTGLFSGVKSIIDIVKKSPTDFFGIVGKYHALFNSGLKVGTILYNFFTRPGEELLPDEAPAPIKVEKWFTEGKIDLKGYISNFASNNCAPVCLLCKGSTFKGNSHVGTGVWNLETSPVVYLASDHVMGNLQRFSLQIQDDKKFFYSNSEELALRLVAFLDPTSIKFNLNDKAFKAKSIEVIQYDFGVYPNADKGSTAEFENWLQLSRPNVALCNDEPSGTLINQVNIKPKYHILTPGSFLSTTWDETEDNVKKYTRKKSNISYYGKLVSDGDKHELDYIPNPQIYFPCDGKYIENGVANDLVVNILFRIILEDGSDEGTTVIFSQRFLPEIKLIGGEELDAKYDQLCKYSENCANGIAVDKTNSGVAVYHLTGNQCIDKTMQILKAVLDK